MASGLFSYAGRISVGFLTGWLCEWNQPAVGPFGFKASRSLIPHRAFYYFKHGRREEGGGISAFGSSISSLNCLGNSVNYIQDVVAKTYGSVFHVSMNIGELSDLVARLVWLVLLCLFQLLVFLAEQIRLQIRTKNNQQLNSLYQRIWLATSQQSSALPIELQMLMTWEGFPLASSIRLWAWDFYEVIVVEAEGQINFHLIEIKSN